MKKLLKLMVVIGAALACVGCAYMELVPEKNVETRWFVETARKGDTFNGIVEQYYDQSIRANKSWNEWQNLQKDNNEKLFANGRALQPGDKVLIVTKVRVAK